MPPPPGLRPDAVLAFVLLDITIILIVARLMGGLAQKVKQPRVVGEIVAGVLLGPTLLGPKVFTWGSPWKYLECQQALTTLPMPMRTPSITACLFPPQARSVLGLLGQIALILFMFLVGLELDFRLLKGKAKGILSVAFGAVAVPIALGFLVGPALYNSKFVGMFGTPAQPSKISFTLMVGAMLSVTAFPVMARILQEKKLTQSPMGSIGIASAAVVTVIMFLAVLVASGVASNQGPSSLGVKFFLTALYIGTMFLVIRPALIPLARRHEARGSVAPGMFAAIIILLFASAYVAHKLGINVIVGGFLAGAILPAREGLFRDMAARLSDFTAIILLPIFLAFSGLQTDFTRLGVSFLGGIGIFLLAGIVGKWLGGALFARLGGLSWAEGNVIGVLMNCRGLLVLVVALIAFTQNVISPQMQVGGVLMALITTAMTGPLFDRFVKRIPAATPAVPGEAVPSPQAPGAFRVLAVITDVDRAPGVAHAAFSLTGSRRPAEVVLCRLFPMPRHGEILSAINDELIQVDRTTRALRMLTTFSPGGVSVTPIAAASDDVAEDVIRVAQERSCDLILVEYEGRSLSLVRELLERAPSDVVVHSIPSLETTAPDGPVTAFGSGTNELAEALAGTLGRPVASADATADTSTAIELSARSGALVLLTARSGPGSGGLDGDLPGELLERAQCPVFVLRPRRLPTTSSKARESNEKGSSSAVASPTLSRSDRSGGATSQEGID